MAEDKKISELGVAPSLDGTETLEIVQGGVNKKTTAQAIADLGPTVTPTLAEVLAESNSASGLIITDLAGPSSPGDATNKGYVDSILSGATQSLADVLGVDNDAAGIAITNLPAPSAGGDATNKTYVDSVASGSNQFPDFTLLTDAAPIVVDCGPVKEPKFYLELSNSRTLDLTDLRIDSVNLAYSTLFFWIKKKVAGDLVLTLDSGFTNIDMANQGSATSYTLSGPDESDFFLTAVGRGEASSCTLAWNLVSDVTGGGGGAVDSVNGETGVVVLVASEIGSTATGSIAATNVQSAIAELDGDIQGHISDSSAAHAASAISFSATGTVSATDVQTAIAELDTEKIASTYVVGVQDLFLPAAAWWPRLTNGCAFLAQSEMATSLVNIQTLDFDSSTQEFAQLQLRLPNKWNAGTITVEVHWTATSGSGGVVFGISGGAYSNDDAMTVALGTAQTMTDTLLAANDLHITPTSSAMTFAGSPADADMLILQLSRNPADGSDTLAVDAKVLGVVIHVTTDAGKDA